MLARKPAEIPLIDVYRAVEDSDFFSMHRSPPSDLCLVGRNIQTVLRPVLDRAQAALEAELARTTLADVASDIALRKRQTTG